MPRRRPFSRGIADQPVWGSTRADQSRLWDYTTPAGSYAAPANQPASLRGENVNTSDMWSAEHALLDTPEGHALIHGGFSPDRAFTFDPSTLSTPPHW